MSWVSIHCFYPKKVLIGIQNVRGKEKKFRSHPKSSDSHFSAPSFQAEMNTLVEVSFVQPKASVASVGWILLQETPISWSIIKGKYVPKKCCPWMWKVDRTALEGQMDSRQL